jgi:hypothetical protein
LPPPRPACHSVRACQLKNAFRQGPISTPPSTKKTQEGRDALSAFINSGNTTPAAPARANSLRACQKPRAHNGNGHSFTFSAYPCAP